MDVTTTGDPLLGLVVVWGKNSSGAATAVLTHDGNSAKKLTSVEFEPECSGLGASTALIKVTAPYRDDANEHLDLKLGLPNVAEAHQDHEFGVFTRPGWSLKVKVNPKSSAAC